jgi:hypothetical protein
MNLVLIEHLSSVNRHCLACQLKHKTISVSPSLLPLLLSCDFVLISNYQDLSVPCRVERENHLLPKFDFRPLCLFSRRTHAVRHFRQYFKLFLVCSSILVRLFIAGTPSPRVKTASFFSLTSSNLQTGSSFTDHLLFTQRRCRPLTDL